MKKEYIAPWLAFFKTLHNTFIQVLAMLAIVLSSLIFLATVKVFGAYFSSWAHPMSIEDAPYVVVNLVLFIGSLFVIVMATRVLLFKAEDTRDEDMQRYMEEGRTAYSQSLNMEDNPYLPLVKDKEKSTEALCWEEGWKTADYAMLAEVRAIYESDFNEFTGEGWMRKIVAQSEHDGLRVASRVHQSERIEFLKRLNDGAESRRHATAGVVIECVHSEKGLVGFFILNIEWRPASFRLYLSINDVQFDPKFQFFVQEALDALSVSIEKMIFQCWDLACFIPIVIIDVADSIPDALYWRGVLSETFEYTQNEGDLTLVVRGGDKVSTSYSLNKEVGS